MAKLFLRQLCSTLGETSSLSTSVVFLTKLRLGTHVANAEERTRTAVMFQWSATLL